MRVPNRVPRSPRPAVGCALLLSFLFLGAFAASASAQVLAYSQPHDGSGTVHKSAWYPPDGMDGDAYVYDDFILGASTAITEVRWRGGYTNYLSGAGKSPVFDFRVRIWASTPGLVQPDIVNPPLVDYTLGTNAGETLAGTFGGVEMYDYAFTLPTAFLAVGGERYWLQVEASQGVTPFYMWPPDWGFAAGTGGTGHYFRAITGGTAGGGTLYQTITGDACFSLWSSGGTVWNIAASVDPPGTGSVLGAGPYPDGAAVSLVATPVPGWGFASWTEAATVVSTNPTYAFTAGADRTLVANFVPAYTVSVAPSPHYGGSVTGAGTYNTGAPVALTATPAPGFQFIDWTEYGTLFSAVPNFSFPSDFDHVLVANFTPVGLGAQFDFDTATPALSAGQGLGVTQTAGGVTATFAPGPGSAFSIQSGGSTQWVLPYFSGLWVMPNNQNRNMLQVTFDRPLDGIWFDFATTDNNQTELPSLLRLTAWLGSTGGTPVGTASVRGAYIGGTFPMGMFSYLAPSPFDIVQLVVPYQPLGTTEFLVDNFTVKATPALSAPPPAPPALALSAGPNPARGSVALTLALPRESDVRLRVHDLQGRAVRTLVAGREPAGSRTVHWDGRDDAGARLAPGAYVVRLESAMGSQARRVVLLR